MTQPRNGTPDQAMQLPDCGAQTELQCGAAEPPLQGHGKSVVNPVVIERLPSVLAHGAIRAYQLTLSGLIGRHCRHWPSCSDYTDEAIRRHGLWAGGWMGLARICRCRPGGTDGLDFVLLQLPEDGAWYRPWRYGLWRSTCVDPVRCEPVPPMPDA